MKTEDDIDENEEEMGSDEEDEDGIDSLSENDEENSK